MVAVMVVVMVVMVIFIDHHNYVVEFTTKRSKCLTILIIFDKIIIRDMDKTYLGYLTTKRRKVMKTTEYKNINIRVTDIKIKKHYTNGFAQSVYELENGAKLYISYNGDELRVEEKIK